MWCWETLGPGIHTDASEHESPNQTLLQTKYNLSQQLSWHCPPQQDNASCNAAKSIQQ